MPMAPEAQHHQRVTPAVAHPAVHEDVLALEVDAHHVGRQLGQRLGDLAGQVGLDDFVGVQAEHPVAADVERVEGPLKLLGLVDEGVRVDLGAPLPRDLGGAIGGAGVHHTDLVGERLDGPDGPCDVAGLVVGEDDRGDAHRNLLTRAGWRFPPRACAARKPPGFRVRGAHRRRSS